MEHLLLLRDLIEAGKYREIDLAKPARQALQIERGRQVGREQVKEKLSLIK